MQQDTIICGDALHVLRRLPDASVHMVCTSPPYWRLRDYGVAGQLGLESSYTEYISKLCNVFDEVKRVLRPDGTAWVNLGDTYSGSGGQKQPRMRHPKALQAGAQPSVPRTDIPRKSLCLIPFRFAVEMVRRGWLLRNVIIWHKPNVIPESVTDRFTLDFEYLFFFAKAHHYYYQQQFEPATERGVRQGAGYVRNKRSVWSIPTKGYLGRHYATYPEALLEIPIRAGCPSDGVVLDPFLGAGTTALVAQHLGRRCIGIELNPAYAAMARERVCTAANSTIRKGGNYGAGTAE